MSDAYQPDFLETAEAVNSFLTSISGVSEIAVDTEAASFHRYKDRVYLLQLSTRELSAIIDPLNSGNLAGLGKLLEDPNVESVFHDADYDVRLLRQDYGWRVNNIFDTRIAAQLIGIPSFGLAALLEKYFSVKLDKAHQRADWSMRPLTMSMLDYAAQDTRYLLRLRDNLHAELEKLGRLHWAKEEFVRVEKIKFAEEDTENSFLRVKGARDLSGRELALLRELVRWRDGLARELDRATFRVVSNETLIHLSKIQPKRIADLNTVKGISRSVLERHAGDIIAAVQRGLEVPDAELPVFPRGMRWARDPDFDENVARLREVRERIAGELQLDPGVLCARDRLEAVARKKPATLEDLKLIPELRAWQIEVLGPDMLAAISSS